MQKEGSRQEGILALPRLDWRAYGIAGLVAGLTSLLASLLLSALVLGDAGFILRLSASLVLGPGVIAVTDGNTAWTLLVGLLVHFTLAFAYASLIVLVVHRWGLAIGVVGGAILGPAMYWIAFYGLSYFFPWIYPLRNWMVLVTPMILGGLVGAVYELMDEYDLPFPTTSGS